MSTYTTAEWREIDATVSPEDERMHGPADGTERYMHTETAGMEINCSTNEREEYESDTGARIVSDVLLPDEFAQFLQWLTENAECRLLTAVDPILAANLDRSGFTRGKDVRGDYWHANDPRGAEYGRFEAMATSEGIRVDKLTRDGATEYTMLFKSPGNFLNWASDAAGVAPKS